MWVVSHFGSWESSPMVTWWPLRVTASTGSVLIGTLGAPLCWLLTGWDAPCRAEVGSQGWLAWCTGFRIQPRNVNIGSTVNSLALLQHHAINQWWFMILSILLVPYLLILAWVSCLCLNQWPLAFLMTPSDWTMSCHVLITDDGHGWKHHWGTYKFLCRMDNFSSIYFNYIYINKKNWLFLYDTVKGVFSNW